MNVEPGAAMLFHATVAVATLAAFGSMLKFMVKDKLVGIKEAIDELKDSSDRQGERIRELELDFTDLRAKLTTRGCLGEAPHPKPESGWRC